MSFLLFSLEACGDPIVQVREPLMVEMPEGVVEGRPIGSLLQPEPPQQLGAGVQESLDSSIGDPQVVHEYQENRSFPPVQPSLLVPLALPHSRPAPRPPCPPDVPGIGLDQEVDLARRGSPEGLGPIESDLFRDCLNELREIILSLGDVRAF